MVDTSKRDGGGGPYVNALALLWLVRIRRAAKLIWQGALVVLVVLFCTAMAAAAWAPRSSTWFSWGNHPETSLLVTLCVIAGGIAVMLALRIGAVFGDAAALAAKLVPVVTRGRNLTVMSNADAAKGFTSRLRRHGFVAVWNVIAVFLLVLFSVLMVRQMWPVWQANHGHGGVEVTVGDDASINGATSRIYSSARGGIRGHTDYFIATPAGTSIVESGGKPQPGEHFIVRPSSFGNGHAYRIGAHDYLLVGVLAIVCVAAAVLFLGTAFVSIRAERRARERAGHAPLSESIKQLSAGARTRVTLGHGAQFDLGLRVLDPEHRGDPDAAVRRVRRRYLQVGTGAVAAVAVVAAVVVPLALADHSEQPVYWRARLPYLADTQWATTVGVYTTYEDYDAAWLRTVLRDGGVRSPALQDAYEVRLSGDDAAPGASTTMTVGRTGAKSASAFVRGGLALRNGAADGHAVAIDGLPDGWGGVIVDSGDPGERVAYVYGAGNGMIVEAVVGADDVGAVSVDARLRAMATDLVTALDRAGLRELMADTAR